MRISRLVARVQAYLAKHPELRKPEYHGKHPLAGHCYVASETLFHLLGGSKAGWKPVHVRHRNVSHWILTKGKTILDATAAQFDTEPEYHNGRGKGFLTKKPSKRSLQVINAIGEHR